MNPADAAGHAQHSSPPALAVLTRQVPDVADLAATLPAGAAHETFSWVREGEGFVGHGVAWEARTAGPARMEDADVAWRSLAAASAVDDAPAPAGVRPEAPAVGVPVGVGVAEVVGPGVVGPGVVGVGVVGSGVEVGSAATGLAEGPAPPLPSPPSSRAAPNTTASTTARSSSRRVQYTRTGSGPRGRVIGVMAPR